MNYFPKFLSVFLTGTGNGILFLVLSCFLFAGDSRDTIPAIVLSLFFIFAFSAFITVALFIRESFFGVPGRTSSFLEGTVIFFLPAMMSVPVIFFVSENTILGWVFYLSVYFTIICSLAKYRKINIYQAKKSNNRKVSG